MKLKNSLIALCLGAVLTLLLFLSGFSLLSVILFAVGFLIGIVLLLADELFFVTWYQLPWPISKSFLFLFIFVPATIFMFTSSSSIIGSGLILGIGFLRLIDLFSAMMSIRSLLTSSKIANVAPSIAPSIAPNVAPNQVKSQTLSQIDQLSNQVLRGGKDPFTAQELQMITLGLGGLLFILLLKIFLL